MLDGQSHIFLLAGLVDRLASEPVRPLFIMVESGEACGEEEASKFSSNVSRKVGQKTG